MNVPCKIRLALALACVACMTGASSALAQLKTAPAPPPEKWRHLKSQHFDMLSCAPARESKELLVYLEQFRAAFFSVFNIGRAHEGKMTIVLFDDRDQLANYAPAGGSFKRTTFENFMLLSSDYSFDEDPGAAFQRNLNSGSRLHLTNCACIGCARKAANLPYISPVLISAWQHYMSAIVDDYMKDIPSFFRQGLVKFFETTYIKGDAVRIGDKNPGCIVRLRYDSKMLPIDSMLRTATPNTSYLAVNTAYTSQSWLITHYLLAGKHNGPKADAINKFTTLSKDKKLSTGQAFEQSFGASMEEMDKNLKRYYSSLDTGNASAGWIIKVPPKPIADKITTNPADKLDIEYALDVLTLPRKHERDPSDWAEVALLSKPKHSAPHHRLAALALQQRDYQRAIEHLQQAVNLNSDNARVYLTLAALRSRDSLKASPLEGTYLSAEQAAGFRQLLGKAIALDPDYMQAYEAQLFIEAYSENMRAGIVHEAIAAIGPRRDRYPVAMTALAIIAWRNKDLATSRRIVDALLPDLPPVRTTSTAKKSPSSKTTAQTTSANTARTRANMTTRRSLPMDFSYINYGSAVRQLDKLLAANEQKTKQID